MNNGSTTNYGNLSTSEIKSLISAHISKLHQLKADGFFKASEITFSNKYASLEARRRRNIINELKDVLRSRT